MKLLVFIIVVVSALGQTSVYTGLGNSSPYTDSNSVVWAADSGCTASTQFTTGSSITGTPDSTLYQHGRLSTTSFSCTYTVTSNVFYNVTLKFANTQGFTAGQRIFNIVINGAVVRSNFDLATMGVGSNTAFDLGFTIPVSNGQVSVVLNPVTGGAQINAIGITAVAPGTLVSNNTWTGTNTFAGTPPLLATNAGVFTNTQMNEYVTSALNSCSPSMEYTASFGSNFATDALAGCVIVPPASTVLQSNAVAGYVRNSAPSTNAVGGFFLSRSFANNTLTWGINPVVADVAGLTGVTLKNEFDVNVNNASTVGEGLQLTGIWTAQPSNLSALQITKPTGGQWTTGIQILPGATQNNGIDLQAALAGASQNSQQIAFRSTSSGSVTQTATMFNDLNNVFQVSNSGGGLNVTGAIKGGGFLPTTAGGSDLGSASLPHANLWLGTAATNNFKFQPATTAAARTITVPDPLGNDTMAFLAAAQTFTNKTLNVPFTSGTGLQIFNTTTTCTTAASVGATCTTANISLPIAEADTSYRISCTGKGITNVPVIVAATNANASQFTITIAALTAAAATFSSYDCIAGHN